MKHGADSEARVRPRAELYLGRLRAAAPTGDDPADEIALERLARQLGRADLIEDWLDEHGWMREDGSVQPVAAQLATVDNSIRKMLEALGLTSMSRATLRREVLRGDLLTVAEATAWMKNLLAAMVALAPEMREEIMRVSMEAAASIGAVGELEAGEIVAEADEPA